MEQYSVTDPDGIDDPTRENTRAIERFHRLVAASYPRLHIEPLDEDRVTATLSFHLPEGHDHAGADGTHRIWPSSLARHTAAQLFDTTLTWTMAAAHVTPFLAIESSTGTGDTAVTSSCVVMAALGL